MGDSYRWMKTGSGDWNAAANWFDVTSATAAATAPSPADSAAIANRDARATAVTSPASAMELSASGNVALAGDFVTDSLVLGVPPSDLPAIGTVISTIALTGSVVSNSLTIGYFRPVPGFTSLQVVDYGLIETDQGAVLKAGAATLAAGDLRVDGGVWQDLFLSPDHAVFGEGVLIPVKHLINGNTICQVERRFVWYFHLELPTHNLVLANGMMVETYLDTGDRGCFENAGRVVQMFPAFSSIASEALRFAPLVVTGPQVDAARRQIEVQARNRNDGRRRRGRGAA